MSLAVLIGTVVFFQSRGNDACMPRRTSDLTDSYVPVAIQAVSHYNAQLQRYYPLAFTDLCLTGRNGGPGSQADVCVAESVVRLNLLLNDLHREAAKRNLEGFQGLTRSVLTQVEQTSRMTSPQQFHFILQSLLREEKGTGVRCAIAEFLRDLENPSSKLSRNLASVKPLNYLS